MKVKEKIIWNKRKWNTTFFLQLIWSWKVSIMNLEQNKELQVKMAKLSELAFSFQPTDQGFKDIKSIFWTNYC